MKENGLLNEIKKILVPGASWTEIFARLDEIKPSKNEKEIEKVQIYSGVITGPDVHFFSRRPSHDNFPIYKCPKCKRFLKKEAVAIHMRRRHSTVNGAIHVTSTSSACSASPSTSNHSDHPSSSSPTDNSNSSDILEQESLLKLKVRLQGQKQKRAARSRETSFTDSQPPASSSAIVEPPVVLPPRPPSPPTIPRPTSSTTTTTQSSSVPPPPQESRSPRTAKMLGCYLIASTSSSRAKSRSPVPIRVKPLPVPNLEQRDPVRSKKMEKFIRRTRNSSMRSLLDIEEVELIKEPRRHFRIEPKIDSLDEMIERKSPTFKMNQINQEQSEKFPMRNRFFDRPSIAEKVEKASRMPEIPQQCQLEMQKSSMSRNSSPMHSVDLGPVVKRRREMSEDEMIDVTTNSPINEHFVEKPMEIVTVDDDEEEEGNRGNEGNEDDDDGENRRPQSSQGMKGQPSLIPTPAIPAQESVPPAQQQPSHTFRSKAELKEIPKKEKKETSSVSTSRVITAISPNFDDGNSMDSNHTEPMYSERTCEERREGSAPILEKPENEEKEEATSSSGPADDVDDGPPVLFPQIDAYALEDEMVDLADLDGIELTPFDAPSTSSTTQHSRPLPKILPQPLHQSPLQTFHTFSQPSTSFQLVHPGIQHASHLSQTGQSPQLLARPMTAHPQLPSSSTNTPQQPQVPLITAAPGGQPRKLYFQQPQLPRSTAVVLVHPPSSIYSQQQFQVVGREQEWANAGLPSNGMAPIAQAAVASSLQGPTAYPYTTRPTAAAAPIAFTADIRVIGADGTEYRYASQPVRPRMTSYIALQSPHLVHLQPGHSAGPSQLGHTPHLNQPQLIQPVQQILQPTPQPAPIEQSPYLFIRSHDAFPHQYPGEGWEPAFEPLQQTIPIDIRPQQVYAVHMPTSRITETSRIRFNLAKKLALFRTRTLTNSDWIEALKVCQKWIEPAGNNMSKSTTLLASRILTSQRPGSADYYYQNVTNFQKNPQKVNARRTSAARDLFKRYANKREDGLGPDRIGPWGVSELLSDLRLEATDRRVLILAWLMKAKTQCEFSTEEWNNGFKDLGVNTIDELRGTLENWEKELENNRAKFRELYQFSFLYGKPERQRNMDCEIAITYWQILFKDRYVLLDKWESFLREKESKAITKDVWNLVFEFFEKINPNLSNYDDDGAWPTLLDNFVEHLRKERAAGAA
ncbi:unnamed protein product, partial [Mesorhabditis belari]|uniref:Defective in cullin neddylation protein n=1 Tax=Mesorhabditis belari TaxID=2138241 RepID=A0AAF3J9F2_9BILA